MSRFKEDNEAIPENSCEHIEKSPDIRQESTFVTPGIFRRRKMYEQVMEGGSNDAKENEGFKWSIDQLAQIRPMEFDETEEFSFPPEDWDPGAEFNRHQLENVDHFWTRNMFIAPSPEVFGSAVASSRFHSSASPTISSHQLVLSPLNSDVPSCSSNCSLSNSPFMSPMMLLTRSQMSEFTKTGVIDRTYETTEEKTNNSQLIADGSEDFDQLERSFSFEVANCIVADMDNGEGFILMEMRKEGPSVDPIEEGN